jgi:hypothetical protein
MLILILCGVLRAGIVKLGIITDIHATHSEWDDNPGGNGRYYSQVETKVETVVDDFVTASVDAIIELGDLVDLPSDINQGDPNAEDPSVLDNIVDSLKNGSGSAHGIDIYYVLGNHECAYEAKSTFLERPSVNQTGLSINNADANGEYGCFDVGNVRCFILDSCYGNETDSYPDGYAGYAMAYISTAQLSWLEDELTIADAANKFSALFFHHPLDIVSTTFRSLDNTEDVINVIEQHRVVLVASGHAHSNGQSKSICQNSLGQPILCIMLEAAIDGNSMTSGAVVSIDDQTGGVNIEGLYNGADSKMINRYVWSGGGNTDGLTEATAWTSISGAITAIKADSDLYDGVTNKVKTDLTLWVKGSQILSSGITISEISSDSANGYRFIIRGYGTTIGDNIRANIDGDSNNIIMLKLDKVDGVILHSLEIHNSAAEGVYLCSDDTEVSSTAIIDCKIYGTSCAIYSDTTDSQLQSLLINHCELGPVSGVDGCVNTNAITTIFTDNMLDGWNTSSSINKHGLCLNDYVGGSSGSDAGGRQFAEISNNIFTNCDDAIEIGASTFDGVVSIHNNTFYGISNDCIAVGAGNAEVVEYSNIFVVDVPVSGKSLHLGSGTLMYSDYSITNSTNSSDAIRDMGDNLIIITNISDIGFIDANNGDFRLHESSIALNTGPSTVLNGQTSRGAWQGISRGGIPPHNCTEWLEMDFNGDCRVDFQDYTLFAESWLDCNLDPPETCWE